MGWSYYHILQDHIAVEEVAKKVDGPLIDDMRCEMIEEPGLYDDIGIEESDVDNPWVGHIQYHIMVQEVVKKQTDHTFKLMI